MSLGVLFGLLTMLSFGLTTSFTKPIAQKLGGMKTVMYRQILIVPLLLVALFIFPPYPVTLQSIIIVLLIGVFGYVPLLLFNKAVSKGDIAIVGPIANTSMIYTIILSITFLSETISFVQIIAICAIVVGVVFIGSGQKLFTRGLLQRLRGAGIVYALGASLLWGAMFFLFKVGVDQVGPVLTALLVEVSILVCSYIHYRTTVGEIQWNELSRKNRVNLLAIAFFASIAGLSYNHGVMSSQVSLVVAIASGKPIVHALYGSIVYGEKIGGLQRLGIVVTIAGLVILSGLLIQ